MKRDNWPVEQEGIRPAGPPDACFYCKTPLGSQHTEMCVVRVRTVVVEFKVEMLVTIPETWTQEQIEFHYNDGSWCATNVIAFMEEQDERLGCLCNTVEAAFLREATEEDQIAFKVFVGDMES